MVELLRTGIQGFDDVLGGGLPSRSLILLTGEPGSHYDTFAQQTLYNCVLHGGKVAYYTVEAFSLDVEDDMSVYDWKIKQYIENGSWVFVNVLTPGLQELSELSPLTPKEARISLTQSLNTLKRDFLARIKEGRWTAIHLSHLLLEYDFRDVVNTLLYARLVTRHHGGLQFILAPAGVHEEQKMNALKHLADGVLEFTMRERAREYEGIITIRKLRKTLHRTKMFPFLVSSKGIYIERAERIA